MSLSVVGRQPALHTASWSPYTHASARVVVVAVVGTLLLKYAPMLLAKPLTESRLAPPLKILMAQETAQGEKRLKKMVH